MMWLGVAVALLLLLWCSLLYIPFRWRPVGIYLAIEKWLSIGYLPFIAALGSGLAAVGIVYGVWWIAVPAGLAAVGALIVMVRVGSVRVDLSGALGAGWPERIPPVRRAGMVRQWWARPLPRSPEPRWRRDLVFASVPDTGRDLLCDVWQPSAATAPSGLAVVYLHGGAYSILDKDCGTRPLFRHLAAQGHVVMDVAYRMFPETDVPGMVADAKRAVAWMRAHGSEFGVDPAKIVVAGGSSGGHLSLLAAYGNVPAFTPPELAGSDLSVAAVVSMYGQVGLDTLYWHCSQDKVCHPDDPQPDWSAPPSPALRRIFGADADRLRLHLAPASGSAPFLVGGTPDELPDRYAEISAFSYVGPGCPPTLLMHGKHDEMAPVAAVRRLQRRLEEAGVPVSAVYLPHTDHAFDLIGTRWSPAARVAVYTLERFFGVIAAAGGGPPRQRRTSELPGGAPRRDGAAATPRSVSVSHHEEVAFHGEDEGCSVRVHGPQAGGRDRGVEEGQSGPREQLDLPASPAARL